MSNFWKNKRAVIIGGAALIGSHLAERLIAENVKALTIIDNLYTGNLRYVPGQAQFVHSDARELGDLLPYLHEGDFVFHLACQHGGRGFVGGGHEIELWDNLTLDGKIFRACATKDVEKVVFMSSACAYPTDLQTDINSDIFLSEDMVDYNNIKQADGPYGMAKLMGEHSLKSYVKAGELNGSIVRGFTVYGPRMKENHAICALIAKTLIKQNPFEIWGDGKQKRNWTYVTDTVDGILRTAEFGRNGEAYNIGVKEVKTPNEAAEAIWREFHWMPDKVNHSLYKPTGPVNRIANPAKAVAELGWEPKVSFENGLKNTIAWYLNTHIDSDIADTLESRLYSK